MHLDLLDLLALTPICHGGWVVCLGQRRRDRAFCNLSREKHRVPYLLFKTSNPKALIVHSSLSLIFSQVIQLCFAGSLEQTWHMGQNPRVLHGSDLRRAMVWLSAFE